MANPTIDIPRDIKSDLHDKADSFGEQIARGSLVTITAQENSEIRMQHCTCGRYSKEDGEGYVKYWNRQNPNCNYAHPAPLPGPYRIKIST